MAIPFNTTTIAILRLSTLDQDGEPYQGAVPTAVVTGVRACISLGNQGGSGREKTQGGEQSVIRARLSCDPVDLRHTDIVKDETTQEEWFVEWTEPRVAFGLDHRQAALRQVQGRV
jgi:hypothetical protein